MLLLCLAAGLLSGAQSERAKPANPAIQTHFRQAQQALAAKNYPEAEREFQALLRLAPNMAEAHANLGTVYYAQSRYSEAAKTFRKALQLKPGLKGAGDFLGMSLARLGQTTDQKEALPLLEKAFQNPISEEWKAEAGLLLADAYQRMGEWVKLQQVVASLERQFATNPEVLYFAYRVHASLGARAVAALVKSAPGSARLHQLSGELLETDGDWQAAVSQYRKALAIDPKLPGCHRALGVALLNLSTDDAARREAGTHFQDELAINPNDAASEYQLGEMLYLENQPADALKHLSRALELQPQFPDALIAAGKAYTAVGQPERAVVLIEKATLLDPGNEVARYRLARAYQKLGNKQRADVEFAEYRRLRESMEALGALYRQILGSRVTAQKVE